MVNLSGGQRGVSDYEWTTGRVYYNPINTEIVEYPTFVQTAKWTRSPHEGDNPESGVGANEEISFNSFEGMSITADISLSYHLLPEKIPAFYVKFRSDDIKAFTHGYLRNQARDAFNETGGSYHVEEIMGSKKEELLKKVREKLSKNVEDIGVIVDQLGFIESPRPPQSVIDSINAKVQAQQIALQKTNEVMQAEADAKKAEANAEGQAESNKILTNSLTPQLIEWQKIQIEYAKLAVNDRWIARWNGQVPYYSAGGNTNSPGLMFTAPK